MGSPERERFEPWGDVSGRERAPTWPCEVGMPRVAWSWWMVWKPRGQARAAEGMRAAPHAGRASAVDGQWAAPARMSGADACAWWARVGQRVLVGVSAMRAVALLGGDASRAPPNVEGPTGAEKWSVSPRHCARSPRHCLSWTPRWVSSPRHRWVSGWSAAEFPLCVTFAFSLGIQRTGAARPVKRSGVQTRGRLVIHSLDGENRGATLSVNPCRSMALRANE